MGCFGFLSKKESESEREREGEEGGEGEGERKREREKFGDSVVWVSTSIDEHLWGH